METKCKDLIEESYSSRIAELRAIWEAEKHGEDPPEDLCAFHEYGLCFDYVAMGTFNGQKETYYRFQISWRGPQEEYRFFKDRIEFWYLSWFDSAHKVMSGDDLEMLKEIFEYFEDLGMAEKVREEAEEY